MRMFDLPGVGVYLDAVGLRLEKTKDSEMKVIDLTLRVQPFTPELAVALDPDVRAFLFTMNDARPKPKLKTAAFNLAIPKQRIDVAFMPTNDPALALLDVEITDVRARTEKGVDGLALIFYATFGPVGKDELEYVVNWYTQQRFLTFHEQQPELEAQPAQTSTHRRRSNAAAPPVN